MGLNEKLASAARKAGFVVSRVSSEGTQLPVETAPEDRRIIEHVRSGFTMTSAERVWTLLEAVRYLEDQRIPGDFVECGVWRGGSVMAMALKLLQRNSTSRNIWLYDTYAGMTPPTAEDVEASSGIDAQTLLDTTAPGDGNNVWCIAGIEDVKFNVESTGYPKERFIYVVGDVTETLSTRVPESIALLRLDTDWYASTRESLEVLYSRLAPGGVCILDDYGHWSGARQAVDEYFAKHGPRPFMQPIDYSGRIFIKPAPQQR